VRSFLLVTVLLLAALLGLTAIWVGQQDAETDLLEPNDPIVTQLGQIVDDGSQGATVRLEWGRARQVIAPAPGVVTMAALTAAGLSGEELSGTVLVEIDGVGRLATTYPFYRELSVGMSGADADELNRLLGTTGGMIVTAETSLAVDRAAARLGAPPAGGVFSPSLTVFVPRSGRLNQVLAVTGDLVQVGQPIWELTPTLEEARLQLTGDLSRSAFLRSLGSVVVESGGLSIEFGESEVVDAAELSRLGQELDSSATEIRGNARSRRPVQGAALPVEAIVVSDSGEHTCLALARSEGLELLAIDTTATPDPGIRLAPLWLASEPVAVNAARLKAEDFLNSC